MTIHIYDIIDFVSQHEQYLYTPLAYYLSFISTPICADTFPPVDQGYTTETASLPPLPLSPLPHSNPSYYFQGPFFHNISVCIRQNIHK